MHLLNCMRDTQNGLKGIRMQCTFASALAAQLYAWMVWFDHERQIMQKNCKVHCLYIGLESSSSLFAGAQTTVEYSMCIYKRQSCNFPYFLKNIPRKTIEIRDDLLCFKKKVSISKEKPEHGDIPSMIEGSRKKGNINQNISRVPFLLPVTKH